jgi:hypothetical protein
MQVDRLNSLDGTSTQPLKADPQQFQGLKTFENYFFGSANRLRNRSRVYRLIALIFLRQLTVIVANIVATTCHSFLLVGG